METNYNKSAVELKKHLEKLNLKVKHTICYSNGESHYLIVNDGDFKIRISDHSVGSFFRVANEIHISNENGILKQSSLQNAIDRIEYYYFSNRFELIDVKYCFPVSVTVRKQDLRNNDIIISERISKRSGEIRYEVQRISCKIVKKIQRL